jgi:hypothetical protein
MSTPAKLTPLGLYELIRSLSRPRQLSLRCHWTVIAELGRSAAAMVPEFTGQISSMAGVPVIEDTELDPGEWRLLDGLQIIEHGQISWIAALFAPGVLEEITDRLTREYLPQEMQDAGLRFEWR